ncbi:MAG: hypothetical protein ACKOC5_00990, partial [Chloroflexota bacterium]
SGRCGYYACAGQHREKQPDNRCVCHRSLRQDWVESTVWAEVVRVLRIPGEIERQWSRMANSGQVAATLEHDRVRQVQVRLADVERRMLRLAELYEIGQMDTDILVGRSQALQNQRRELRKELAQAQARQARTAAFDDKLERIKILSSSLAGEDLECYTLEQRQGVIDALDLFGIVTRGATKADDRIELYID